VDFSHYSDVPVEVAVRFTNTLNVVTGKDALQAPQDVADFIVRELREWGHVPATPDERHLQRARELRSRLRSVWDAPDAATAAVALNEVLEQVGARPRLSVHGDHGPHLHFEPERGDPVDDLGAVAAMGLSVALIEGGWERFGTCSSSSCDDVFIDTSKNRSRRHCSDTCTTRESVAAFRARQRSNEDAPASDEGGLA
jgi:predicted RNA-binding Zn ribbon-like protein